VSVFVSVGLSFNSFQSRFHKKHLRLAATTTKMTATITIMSRINNQPRKSQVVDVVVILETAAVVKRNPCLAVDLAVLLLLDKESVSP
jgi:hypothetical protein